MDVSHQGPKLFWLIMNGPKEAKINERLYKPIKSKLYVDVALKFYWYAEFSLDYMLAQKFNYEHQNIFGAYNKDLKHVVWVREVLLGEKL